MAKLKMEYSTMGDECGEWNYDKQKWITTYIRCFDLYVEGETQAEVEEIFDMIDNWFIEAQGYEGKTPFAYCPSVEEYEGVWSYYDSINVEYLKDMWMMDTVAETRKEFMADWRKCKKEITTKLKEKRGN